MALVAVMSRAHKNVAQVIVDVLAGVGVKRVYGVAGDSLNGIIDAIFDRDDVAWTHVRHEEVPEPICFARTERLSCTRSLNNWWR